MSDPILDENIILHFLKAPPAAEHVNMIQSGAIQALIDLYDRKVTRAEFCAAAGQCVLLYASASKMMVLESMRELSAENILTADKFSEALSQLAELMRVQSQSVIEMVERLKQCPTSQDKLH